MYYQVVTERDNKVASSRLDETLARISLRFVRDHMGQPARLERCICNDKGEVTSEVVVPHDKEI